MPLRRDLRPSRMQWVDMLSGGAVLFICTNTFSRVFFMEHLCYDSAKIEELFHKIRIFIRRNFNLTKRPRK